MRRTAPLVSGSLLRLLRLSAAVAVTLVTGATLAALAALTATAASALDAPASAADASKAVVPSGWKLLFDGKTLGGWRQINGTAKYRAEGFAIVGTTAKGSPNSFLCTEKVYGDFELQLEVEVDPRLNSGIQIRSESLPEYQNGRVHGYQVEIAAAGYSGYIYDEARRATWLNKDPSDPRAKAAFRRDAWNKYRVLCVGDSIKTWVNDVPVADIRDSMTKRGFIGLQVHSFEGDPPAEVRWRNIWLREIATGTTVSEAPVRYSAPADPQAEAVIAAVEKECLRRPVYMIGPQRGALLASLVREAKPALVVECGTAIGYSGLWIARELKAAKRGKLISIEIDAERAKQARANFDRAGLGDVVEVRVGDARQLASKIEGPVDFLFLDCDYPNYRPCLRGIEPKLAPRAVIVADNVGIGATGMTDYLDYVRSKYRSTTEWFDIDLPWGKRDAIEVTIVGLEGQSQPVWTAAMQSVHSRFTGQAGTFAQFGDSITVSLAFWTPLLYEPRALSDELAGDLKLVREYQRNECWRDWKGPKFGNEGGMTIRWAYENIDGWLRDLNPEVAVIMFGTNDLTQLDCDEYEAKTRSVVERCLSNGTVTILTTIPPRHGLAERSAEFAEVVRKLAAELKVPLIDYQAEIVKRRPDDWDGASAKFEDSPGDEYNVLTLIARDGVHPSNPRDFQDYSERSLRANGFALRNALTLRTYADVIRGVLQAGPTVTR